MVTAKRRHCRAPLLQRGLGKPREDALKPREDVLKSAPADEAPGGTALMAFPASQKGKGLFLGLGLELGHRPWRLCPGPCFGAVRHILE